MMFGAKGSNKNRVYQFWLIRVWKEKRKKRQEKTLLKKKRMEEMRNKVIEEVIGRKSQRCWKLSESPAVFRKKEGVKITIYPLGKKPDKVIEVYEEKKKVGIGENPEVVKELTQIAKEATVVATSVKSKRKEDAKGELKLEDKKKQLELDLKKIEYLQTEYQTMVKKNPHVFNVEIIKNPQTKKKVNDVLVLKQVEEECRKELERVEKALKVANQTETLEKKEQKVETRKIESKKEGKLATPTPKVLPSQKKNNQNVDTEVSKPLFNKKAEILKTGAMIATVTGGTLVAFPALLQRTLSANPNELKTKGKEIIEEKKEKNQKKTIEKNLLDGNDIPKSNVEKKVEVNQKKEHPKLKLYHSKLEASKEAEILVKAELERQRNYLRRLNEKIEKMEVTKRVDYHFKGLHRLLGNILTFTLGIFTIPFSKHRIFGTAVGLTLIGNSIRGMRNSLKVTKEESYYMEWKNFAKVIYNEQLALNQMKHLVIDSLEQIKGLKEDIEREFYGKVPFEEYDEMRMKLEVIELKLVEKQKQIEEMNEKVKQVEEKNKVKVKQMEDFSHRQ